MPQGSDLSKSIRTMKKDIDRARRGGPDEEYVSPVPQDINKGAAAPVLQVDLTNPRPKPAVKPGDSFVKPTQPNPVSAQGIQMQKLAEDKQRVEKLRIEEQQKKEAMEKSRLLEEEKKRKAEEQKKEEERRKKSEEEKK
ncbi:MAG: hypothetical protein NT148_01685, partial [Candidatus Nealsonbacteria bacterium]|nr:hypothetical protein [Candidatus Nealsonbacteria bacterium]